MNAAALLLYAAFAVVAFGWRTWLQWRRTGDTGLRIRATTGSLQWWAKLAFVVAILTGAVAPIAGLAGLGPLRWLDSSTLQATGAVTAIAGIVATAAAQLEMGASWRIGVDTSERTELVTTGVFGTVRNPIFTAMLITAGGLALMVGNLIAVIGLAALIVALEFQVRYVEEPYLRSVHGSNFDRYMASTGRFMPRVGRADHA